MKNIDYSLYLVTDRACIGNRPLLECVEEALKGGITLVQYRSKDTEGGRMYEEALALKNLCDRYGVPLIINDRVDVALAVEAAGVHVGQEDLPCKIARALAKDRIDFVIGVSCHNPQEALQALADGADYIGCGAVFGSQTKGNVGILGLDNLRAIHETLVVAGAKLPVVGIGGITASNYAEVLDTGANGAAVVSGILAAKNIYAETQKFIAIKSRNE